MLWYECWHCFGEIIEYGDILGISGCNEYSIKIYVYCIHIFYWLFLHYTLCHYVTSLFQQVDHQVNLLALHHQEAGFGGQGCYGILIWWVCCFSNCKLLKRVSIRSFEPRETWFSEYSQSRQVFGQIQPFFPAWIQVILKASCYALVPAPVRSPLARRQGKCLGPQGRLGSDKLVREIHRKWAKLRIFKWENMENHL